MHQEFLELAELICFSVCLSKIEPGCRGITIVLSGLLEVCLDDLFNLIYPSFFKVVRCLGDRRCLDLFEIINLHGLGNIWVVDVFGCNIITFFADLLLGSNHLVLDLKRPEREFRDLLSKGMLWDSDHSKVWCRFFLFPCWEMERSSYEIIAFLIQVLVEDNLVHCLGKINIDLVKQSGRIRCTFAT